MAESMDCTAISELREGGPKSDVRAPILRYISVSLTKWVLPLSTRKS